MRKRRRLAAAATITCAASLTAVPIGAFAEPGDVQEMPLAEEIWDGSAPEAAEAPETAAETAVPPAPAPETQAETIPAARETQPAARETKPAPAETEPESASGDSRPGETAGTETDREESPEAGNSDAADGTGAGDAGESRGDGGNGTDGTADEDAGAEADVTDSEGGNPGAEDSADGDTADGADSADSADADGAADEGAGAAEDGSASGISYTDPENRQHSNISFRFVESGESQYFSGMSYPVTLSLREVDTGRKLSLTVKSEGQIMEVPKGDYEVTGIKDSGKVPLKVPGDTLSIYDSSEYPVRFAANDGLKMFTEFISDNILLMAFFAIAALLYSKAVIPRFAGDARKR